MEGTIEFYEFVVACVAQVGFVVELVDGSPPAIEWDSAGGNGGAGAAVDRCIETGRGLGWFEPSPFDGSADGQVLLYEIWQDIYLCLNQNGYPTIEPPSLDVFVEGSDWNPYAAMGAGAPLVVTGESASVDLEQLEAQALCGADANSIYQQRLREN